MKTRKDHVFNVLISLFTAFTITLIYSSFFYLIGDAAKNRFGEFLVPFLILSVFVFIYLTLSNAEFSMRILKASVVGLFTNLAIVFLMKKNESFPSYYEEFVFFMLCFVFLVMILVSSWIKAKRQATQENVKVILKSLIFYVIMFFSIIIISMSWYLIRNSII